MLAMAEDLGGHVSSLFWDEDSWAFPILAAQENDGGGNMSTDIGDQDNRRQKRKEMEAAAPPPAQSKGKKRKASGGCGDPKNEVKRGGGKGSEGKSGGGDGGGGGDEHEQHIWIERERRKKMKEMFSNLHSLIPHLPPKADKASIVDEAVQYIEKLEQTLESLEKQKKSQMLKGITSITTTYDIPSMNITQNKKHPVQSREVFLADQGLTSKAHVALANPNSLFSCRPAVFKTWTSPNVILNVYGNDAHINICCHKKPGLLTGVCFVLEKYNIELVSTQVSSGRDRCMCMMHAQATGSIVQFPGSLFLVEEIFKQAASEIMVWVQAKCI